MMLPCACSHLISNQVTVKDPSSRVCFFTTVLNNNEVLLSQPQGHSLDEIVVSDPQTPARGVVARPPSQVIKTPNRS